MLRIELQNHRLLLTTSDDQTIGLDTLAFSQVGRNVLAQFVLEANAAFEKSLPDGLPYEPDE